MKNDALTLVRMRSGDHLGAAAGSVEKGHLAPSNLTFFPYLRIDTNGFADI